MPLTVESPETDRFRKDGWTPERKVAFLDCLAERGNVRRACARVRLSAEAAYRLRRRDALFAAGWQGAMVVARDHVEQVLADRAIDGVEEVVFYRGEQVGTRRRFDNRLLLAHLARLDRALDRDGVPDLAARFDDLLGLIAEGGEGDAPLPPTREDWCEAVVEAAERDLLGERQHGDPEQADTHYFDQLDRAHAQARVDWQARHDAAMARVDQCREQFTSSGSHASAEAGCGPLEYKSLFAPQDCVNLSTLPRPDKGVGWSPSGLGSHCSGCPVKRSRAMSLSLKFPLYAGLLAAAALVPVVAQAAPVKLSATLSGANETAGGDATASGGFSATVDPETNDFCYSLWADKTVKATMAHVHKGEAGADGAPVTTLDVTGKDNDMCIALDKDKLQPIVDNPAGFYVNIHTAAFPKGALRGQLVKQ